MTHADYRNLFSVPPSTVFLNAANIGPRLHACVESGHGALERWGTPWRITAPDFFRDAEELRGLAAGLMGADADGIALVPSVSFAMATAAANVAIRRGQSIVTLAEEFPSNHYRWKGAAEASGADLVMVARPEAGRYVDAIVGAIESRTAVVSVPICHWTDGTLTGIEKIADRAHAVGASLVIDASQALGALPIDVARLDPDFLVTVGYKWLLGPYGVAYMYVAPRHRAGVPLEEAWSSRAGSEDLTRLTEYTDRYRPGARRFDAGEVANFILLPMAVAALRQMTAWSPTVVMNHLKGITDRIAQGALDLDMSPTSAAERAPHLMGLRVGFERARNIGAALREADIHVSVRGDRVRIAPHMHTTEMDLATLFSALRELRV